MLALLLYRGGGGKPFTAAHGGMLWERKKKHVEIVKSVPKPKIKKRLRALLDGRVIQIEVLKLQKKASAERLQLIEARIKSIEALNKLLKARIEAEEDDEELLFIITFFEDE